MPLSLESFTVVASGFDSCAGAGVSWGEGAKDMGLSGVDRVGAGVSWGEGAKDMGLSGVDKVGAGVSWGEEIER